MIPRGQSTVTGLSLRRMRNEKSPRNTWERFDAGQDMQNGQEAGATLCVYITVTNTLRVTMQYLRVPFYGPNPCSGRYFVILSPSAEACVLYHPAKIESPDMVYTRF